MSPTVPKTGPLAELNRAERRGFHFGRAVQMAEADRTWRGILPRGQRALLGKLRAKPRQQRHPQERKIARLGREMEASLIAAELYPVIDRARGISPR